MRLIGVTAIFILMLISLSGKAQKLTYTRKNIPLVRFFKEIKQQTGFSIAWNEKEFNVNRRIDADYKNLSIKNVLDDISVKLQLTYSMMGKMIVLKDKALDKASVTPTISKAKDSSAAIQQIEYNLQQVEIVSTGYQQIPKERATGSFVVVDSVQLNRRVGPDIFSRLEGITSGLLFNKNTLNTNSGTLDLSIRGRSTIFANDQPLIILDNFPFNGDFGSINPNDVANVTVLKDAAAASIWGVRAGNGVIVITTKRGKRKEPLNITLNSNVTLATKPDLFYNPNYLSSSAFIDIETFLFNHGKYDNALTDQVNFPAVSPVVQILNRQRQGQSAAETAEQLNALRGNDIRKEELKYFYRSPVSQQYFLNASGGTATSNHYFSAGYDKAFSSLVNNDNDRITINSQNTFKLLKNLEVDAGVYYIRATSKVDSTIATTSIGANFLPYYQFKDRNGHPNEFDIDFSPAYKQQALTRGFMNWSYIPLNELGKSPLLSTDQDLRVNGGLKYKLIPGLNAAIKYQYQLLDNRAKKYNSIETYQTRNLINQYSILNSGMVSGYNIPPGGIRYTINGKAIAHNLRTQFTYQKDWQKSAISAILGYELSEFSSDISDKVNYAYDPKTGTSLAVDSTTTFNLNPSGTGKINSGIIPFGKLDRIRSVFMNVAYTLNNKYILSGSARIDGSNYFGVKTNQKNVPLWSAGALWNIDRESFYPSTWLPVLKIRASYGYNGNLDRSNTGITTFKYNGLNATYTGLPFASILNIGNPELRWERIGIANFGIDFGFRDQILSGKIEYYFKNGSDILGDKAFPSSTGIKTLRGNYSKMKANGLDVSLTSQNLTGRLKWTSNFLFSYVHDEVTAYDVIDPNGIYYVGAYSTKPVLDRPVYGIYSYKWAGLDPANGDPRGYVNNELSKNYNAIVNSTAVKDLEYNGAARPTVFGGLNNIFSYSKFTLAFNISYKMGYYFRKPSVNYSNLYNGNMGFFMNRDYEIRWKNPGDELITDVPAMANYPADNLRDVFYNNSSATVAKADHIRLQDVSLAFDLDQSNWKDIPFKKLQLYIYANNLSLLWKANDFGLDPDLIPRIKDRLANPVNKSFSFGLKANF